jgi:hypothetical protein
MSIYVIISISSKIYILLGNRDHNLVNIDNGDYFYIFKSNTNISYFVFLSHIFFCELQKDKDTRA